MSKHCIGEPADATHALAMFVTVGIGGVLVSIGVTLRRLARQSPSAGA